MKRLIVILDNKDARAVAAAGEQIFSAVAHTLYGIRDLSALSEEQTRELTEIIELHDSFPRDVSNSIVLVMGTRLRTKYLGGAAAYGLADYAGQPAYGIASAWSMHLWDLFPDDPVNVRQQTVLHAALARILEGLEGEQPLSTQTRWKVCTSFEDFHELMRLCRVTKDIVFDFETRPEVFDGLSPSQMRDAATSHHKLLPTMLGISYQPGSGWIIPMYHWESPFDIRKGDVIQKLSDGSIAVNGQPRTDCKGSARTVKDEYVAAMRQNELSLPFREGSHVLEAIIFPALKELFEDKTIRKTAHNAKFDMKIARRFFGCEFVGIYDDTLALHHLLGEDRPHGLKAIITEMLPEFAGYESGVDYFNDPLDKLSEYCAVDNDLTFRLRIMLERELQEDPALVRLYRNYTRPALIELAQMEYGGMKISTSKLLDVQDMAESLMEDIKTAIDSNPTVLGYKRAKVAEERDRMASEAEERLESKLSEFEAKLRERVEKAASNPKAAKSLENARHALELVEARRYSHPQFPYKSLATLHEKARATRTGEIPVSWSFSLESPKDLGELIYTHEAGLGHPLPIVTRFVKDQATQRKIRITGPHPSTRKELLDEMDDPSGLILLIREYRTLAKLTSTYIKGIWAELSPSGTVHSNFRTVNTHRLSSSRPNLQNIVSRTRLERVKPVVEGIKAMFVPRPGRTFFQVDLSQAELRFFADMYNIRTMVDALNSEKDLHIVASVGNSDTMTEERYALLEQEDPKAAKAFRNLGKGDNFSLIYRISVPGYREFQKNSYGNEISEEEAEMRHWRFYNQIHPDIPAAHERCIEGARRTGQVRTMFGAIRRLPYILSPNAGDRGKDERNSINTPIQGTGGQWMIFGIVCWNKRSKVLGLSGEITNTVHDSGLGDVPAHEEKRYLDGFKDTLEHPPTREYFGAALERVRMRADVETGPDWAHLKEASHA